jgi:hypothetical protein
MSMDYSYRLKKMAGFCRDARRVLDVGWANIPNPYLRNEEVVGLDLAEAEPPATTPLLAGTPLACPNLSATAFDAVVVGEILEHLEAPLDFCRRCRQVLLRRN